MIKTNNKYDIKFPDEIIVDNTYEVLYKNQEGKLKGNRNSVRYANGNRICNNFPNKPIKGWKIVYYEEGRDGKYSRIYIINPTLFNSDSIKINIRADYMFDPVITDFTVVKGEIQESCVIGFSQSNCPMLIPESHEYYQGASYPNPDLPIPTCARDLIVGAAYDIYGDKSTYIGELKKGLRINNECSNLTIRKQKFYVFFEDKSNTVTLRTGIGKTLISNTISVDDKNQDQCNDILELVKGSVINSENGNITGMEFNLDSIKEVKDEIKFENEIILCDGKQYKAKDCFLYSEQESSTKINMLLKLGNANYIKLLEIDFVNNNEVKIDYSTVPRCIAQENYSTSISEIKLKTTNYNYIPSKPVQKLFSLISNYLRLYNYGHGLNAYWDEENLLGLNLNLITTSGKIFPKQAITNYYSGPVISINITEL